MISKNTELVYLSLAAVNGAIVMTLEISASRLLAPYFGTSIFVWSNIIGVVLAALSLGYFVGGKLSERSPSLRKLLLINLITGIIVLIIPLVVHPLARTLTQSSLLHSSATMLITVGSLICLALLFGLPLMLLGITSPYLIKLWTSNQDHVGEISGKLFAVSTLGSLVGTFLPTLVLIPSLGTKNTVLACGTVLLLIGTFSLNTWKRRLGSLLLGLGFILWATAQQTQSMDLLYTAESAYQHISIKENEAQVRYLTFDAGFGIQSVYDEKNIFTGFYYDYFTVLPHLVQTQSPKKILIIGLAGGTIARQMHYIYGEDMELYGVEIDPKVVTVSRAFMGLGQVPVTIIEQDGRTFLNQTQDTYDIIIVDAYHNELEIPWTLTTREFWHTVQNRLRPQGFTAINIAASNTDARLLEAFIFTASTAFSHLYITNTSDTPRSVSNFMLTMSNNPLSFTSLPQSQVNSQLTQLAKQAGEKTRKIFPKPEALLLTDDKAPVELLTAETLWPDL